MVEHVSAIIAFHDRGIPCVDYGNNMRQMAFEHGLENAFGYPGFVPAYIRAVVLPWRRAFSLGRPIGQSRGYLQDRRQS